MSIKNQNEFETLMRQEVYNDNQIMQKIIDYLERDRAKQSNRYYDELYKEFDELYREIKEEDTSKTKDTKEKVEDLNDEEIENLDDEELDEKVVEDGKEYTRRELLYKELYRKNLQKYYRLRANIHKQDIRQEGDVSFTNHNFKDVLEYEVYLRKLDVNFKRISGSYITKEFEDVNKELNDFVREEEKYQRALDRNYDKLYIRINELNDRLDEISDKIDKLNALDSNYEEKYNSLMDSYIETVSKLHMVEPNILKLQEQEDRKKNQEYVITENIGSKYQKDIKKKSYDRRNFSKDKERQFEAKKHGMHYAKDSTRMENELEETIESHIQVIKANIEAIKAKFKNKDYDNLEELIEDTKNIIAMYNIDRKALEKDISKEDIDMIENIDMVKLKEIKDKDKENNKDAVEKDSGFLQELGFIAGISEISDYEDINNKNNERERER